MMNEGKKTAANKLPRGNKHKAPEIHKCEIRIIMPHCIMHVLSFKVLNYMEKNEDKH